MKFKLERERGKGRQWLCVVPTHGEHVDAGLVRWLSVRHRNRLLDLAPKKEGVLRYDATGLTPLHEFLRQTELTSARYENLLVSTCEAMATCAVGGAPFRALVFHPEAAFADEDGNLHFCFYPVQVSPNSVKRNDPKAFLRGLHKGGHLSLLGTDDLRVVSDLDRFLKGQDGLSLRDFERFLLDTYGVDVVREFAARPAGQPARAAERVQPVQGVEGEGAPQPAKTMLAADLWGAGVAKAPEPESLEPQREPAAPEPAPQGDADAEEPPFEPVAWAGRDGLDLTEVPGWEFDPEPARQVESDAAEVGPAFAPSEEFLLVCQETGEAFSMGSGAGVVVGRGSASDVQIPDNLRISRTHARVQRQGDAFLVTDLGSANGTTVGGRELGKGQSAAAQVGETFLLADVPFKVVRT